MTRPRMSLIEENRSPGARAILAGLFLSLLLSPALAAQIGLELGTTVDHEMPEPGLEASGEQLPLTLEDAIGLALERNLGLAVERYQRSQTLLGVLQSLSIYDLGLSATLSTASQTTARSSFLEDVDAGSISSDQNIYNWNLSQLIPWGGTATVNYTSSRSSSSNQVNIFNPNYNLGLGISYAQPLLRGRGRELTERSIIQARYDNAISLETFELRVVDLIQQVSNAYWNLVEGREQLKVARESLELAEELHEMNKIQVEVGTKAPLETVQSEASVAAREGDIISFTAQVEDSEDVLRQLINLDAGQLWDVEILPVTEPEAPFVEVDVEAAVRQALTERPELTQQRYTIERRELDARFFHNQKLPQLNLTASYGPTATGGLAIFQDPASGQLVTIDQDYFDVFEDLLARDNDGWSLQLSFNYPLQNRSAKAQSAIADLALEESELQLTNLEQDILRDVRRAARAVRTAEKQIEASKVASKLARKNLEAEQKRYENGLATSFNLLEIQEDLSAQLRQEVSAIIAYRTALVDYAKARGILLEEMAVELIAGDD